MDTSRCWLCENPLEEDEVQYCTFCELMMTKEILKEAENEAFRGDSRMES